MNPARRWISSPKQEKGMASAVPFSFTYGLAEPKAATGANLVKRPALRDQPCILILGAHMGGRRRPAARLSQALWAKQPQIEGFDWRASPGEDDSYVYAITL